MFAISYERVSGELEFMAAEFPTADDAQLVCENLWNRYSATEKFARFSVLNLETQEIVTDFEC